MVSFVSVAVIVMVFGEGGNSGAVKSRCGNGSVGSVATGDSVNAPGQCRIGAVVCAAVNCCVVLPSTVAIAGETGKAEGRGPP